MKFSQLAKESAPELIVSRLHDKWLVEDGEYSEAAVRFAERQLTKADRVRRGTVSASSLGGCPRAQQFTFIGMPKKQIEPKGASIFATGDFMHLRWQMAGISAGWLAEAEVPVPESNPYGLAGTMDGVLYENSILELKSINDNGFRSVVSFGPQKKHLMQGAAYALATGAEKVVFIYENKNDQEYREYVRERGQLPIEQAELIASDLTLENMNQELREPLSQCIDREGFEYKFCAYSKHCLEIHTWADAVAIAH